MTKESFLKIFNSICWKRVFFFYTLLLLIYISLVVLFEKPYNNENKTTNDKLSLSKSNKVVPRNKDIELLMYSKENRYITLKDNVIVPYRLDGFSLRIAKVSNKLDLYSSFAMLADSDGNITKKCKFNSDCIDNLFLESMVKKYNVSKRSVYFLILNQELFRSTVPVTFNIISQNYDHDKISRFFLRDTFFYYKSIYPMVMAAFITSKQQDISLSNAVAIAFELNYVYNKRDNIKVNGHDNLNILQEIAGKFDAYFKSKSNPTFSSVLSANIKIFNTIDSVNYFLERVRINNKEDKTYNEVVNAILKDIDLT